MKLKKKLWALLLSAAMIITFLPAAAFADDQTTGSDTAVEETAASEADSTVPVSAKYVGAVLRGVVGTDRILSLENPAHSGNRFDVTFSDGSVKEFMWPEEDESIPEWLEGAFIYDEDTYLYAEVDEYYDDPISFEEGLNKDVKLKLYVHYVTDGGDEIDVLPVVTDVMCSYDAMPLNIEFIPAEGFTLECTAGPNYLSDELFYGEGNQFVITYEGWNDAEDGYRVYKSRMKYFNTTDEDGNPWEGFAINGNPTRYGEFTLDDGVYCEPDLGETVNLEFTYTEFIPEYDRDETVSFTVPVKATKYNPYVKFNIYTYTGEAITPKFKVYNNDEKLIDPSEYEVEYEPSTKMGWYDATITFKDKTKYVDSIIASYGIGPAAPKITKLVAGKKSLTVKWKKLTKKQLRNVDGFYIELATDRGFNKNYKRVWVSKKTVKTGKKLVKGLKKGKRYYVRMYARKSTTQDGEKFNVYSNDSNIKYRKTK